MPIQFRCPACDRMLGIARRKAGSTVKCPRCAADVQVPLLAGIAVETNGPLGAAPPIPKPSPAVPVSASRSRQSASPQEVAKPKIDSMPLFERPDFEALLNPTVQQVQEAPPRPAEPKSNGTPIKPAAWTDDSVDVIELPNVITLTRTKLTIAVAIVAMLLGIAFATGYLLASATGRTPARSAVVTSQLECYG